jgi:hypothetical protein
MRRPARWALNGLTVLSLLLCVATAAPWVRSYGVRDSLRWLSPKRTVAGGGEAGAGSLRLFWVRRVTSQAAPIGIAYATGWTLGRDRPDGYYGGDVEDLITSGVGWQAAGFACGRRDILGYRMRCVVVPMPAIAVVSFCVPLVCYARRRRRHRRSAQGHCPACGYDLTGNVSGVCPECGKATVKGTA